MSRVVILNYCGYHVTTTMATRKHSARISAVGQESWDLLLQLFRDVRANLDNYKAVDNLPPFWMFPFFFIMPGRFSAT